MFLIDCNWVELILPYKDRFWSQCHLPLYLSPHQPVSFFMLKFSMALVSSFLCSNIFIAFLIFWFCSLGFWIFEKTPEYLFMFPWMVRKEQRISYEWLLIKSEPVNVNFGKSLCSRIFWSGTLWLWRGSYVFWWNVKMFSEVEPFFQILKFEFGSCHLFQDL